MSDRDRDRDRKGHKRKAEQVFVGAELVGPIPAKKPTTSSSSRSSDIKSQMLSASSKRRFDVLQQSIRQGDYSILPPELLNIITDLTDPCATVQAPFCFGHASGIDPSRQSRLKDPFDIYQVDTIDCTEYCQNNCETIIREFLNELVQDMATIQVRFKILCYLDSRDISFVFEYDSLIGKWQFAPHLVETSICTLLSDGYKIGYVTIWLYPDDARKIVRLINNKKYSIAKIERNFIILHLVELEKKAVDA